MKGIFVKVVGAVMAMVGLAAQAGTVTYYHNDLLGSPVVATDASGVVVWRESYRPYGERLTNAPASSTNDVWFTGRRQDVDTGLVYMGARYYDPTIGRFISTDPKGFDGANVHSFNRYAYANNNPSKYVDPDGRNPLIVWLATATGAGYGAGVMADAASQAAAWGTIDWGLAMSSNAARAGAEAGLMSPAPGMSVGLSIKSVDVIAAEAGQVSKYVDITAGRSVANRATDVPRADFEKNLLESGWTRSVSKDGKATVFEKDGAAYTVRDSSKEGSKTAEYFKEGSQRADLKIRLGD